jgi:hypothetical protein
VKLGQSESENDLKRLLEGDLLAAFPDETITPEFHFKGIGIADSIVDFAVGRGKKIPIEVKVAEKRIRDNMGKGSGQVKEFLKSCGSDRGILTIADKERDSERQKHSGMQDSVYIIVI